MNEQNSIQLTKDEAMSLFCFIGLNPASLLREKQKQLNSESHKFLIHEIRCMVQILKILLNFKSEEVRAVIQTLCCRFINDIYKNSSATVSIKDLQFLIPIIFKYRNLHDYMQTTKVEYDKSFIESVSQRLLKLNAIDSYQKLLF